MIHATMLGRLAARQGFCRPSARRLIALLAAAVLVGCVSQTDLPRWKIPPGASPAESAEEFAYALASARVAAAYCGGYGIKKTYNDTSAVIYQFAQDLREQGYSEAEITEIGERFIATYNSQVQTRGRFSIPEDVAGYCGRVKAGIAAGDNPGGLLRIN